MKTSAPNVPGRRAPKAISPAFVVTVVMTSALVLSSAACDSTGDCPAVLPTAGGECAGLSQTCEYTTTTATAMECRLVPLPTRKDELTCEANRWVIRPYDNGEFNPPIPCPCEPPTVGENCSGDIQWQTSPCAYAEHDPCQAFVCDPDGSSVLWDVSTDCPTHVRCPSTAPTAGASCEGTGYCRVQMYDVPWTCDEGHWKQIDP